MMKKEETEKRDWYDKNKEAVKKQREESKKQKEWYANNRVRCIEKSKKWNKDNPNARKLIVERHKHKGKIMSMDLSKEQMKERVINYLEYMEEKDLQEIAATLYNLSKRRAEIKQRKDNDG